MSNEFAYKILRPRYRGESGTVYKYELLADYRVQIGIQVSDKISIKFLELDWDGMLTIRKGYLSDGASGPARDTANIMRAAFAHDALYQMLRLGLLVPHRKMRKAADKVFRRFSLEDGVVMARRFIDFWGLRFGGRRAAKLQVA